jgi:hypothetical protein
MKKDWPQVVELSPTQLDDRGQSEDSLSCATQQRKSPRPEIPSIRLARRIPRQGRTGPRARQIPRRRRRSRRTTTGYDNNPESWRARHSSCYSFSRRTDRSPSIALIAPRSGPATPPAGRPSAGMSSPMLRRFALGARPGQGSAHPSPGRLRSSCFFGRHAAGTTHSAPSFSDRSIASRPTEPPRRSRRRAPRRSGYSGPPAQTAKLVPPGQRGPGDDRRRAAPPGEASHQGDEGRGPVHDPQPVVRTPLLGESVPVQDLPLQDARIEPQEWATRAVRRPAYRTPRTLPGR